MRVSLYCLRELRVNSLYICRHKGSLKMKILLIDVDKLRGKLPNLALMKLSAWHKVRGDEVFLLGKDLSPRVRPDKVYISCIFERNRGKALGIAEFWKSLGCDVHVGGYGVNDVKLPYEVEHIRPDYDLYGIDYSLGFTSRGCHRRCRGCEVWRLEGDIRDHAPISEFHHPHHERLILLDNNFLASPKWKENLFYIMERRLKVNFHQGLDIRLVNDFNANLLAHTHFSTWKWKTKMLHFAFDDVRIEQHVRRGVETLKAHGIRPDELTFYMLVGYGVNPEDYTWRYFKENDLYRFEVLRELGVSPFVMLYNDRRDIPLLRHFRRWGTKPRLYKKCPDFEKYDHGDSQKVIRQYKKRAK